jgi:hypothetical protein
VRIKKLDDIISRIFKPVPKASTPRDRWKQFKKLDAAAERHRIESLFCESGADQAKDATASDSPKNQAQTTEEH